MKIVNSCGFPIFDIFVGKIVFKILLQYQVFGEKDVRKTVIFQVFE